MSVNIDAQTLSFRIWENFATDFDELQNITIVNRKSDIWFSEFWQMSIKMRDWTVQVWNSLSWTWWISWQFFFVDFFKKKHHIKWYNKKIWRLNSSTWTDLWISFTSNAFKFNPMLLPMMLDWSNSTIYTTPSDSSAWERVKKDSNDSLWTWAIWKILIITDNSANTQAYRGAFASIIDYDSTNTEYTLNWAGVTTSLKAWAKYQIYDTLWEYFQSSNWAEEERYFFWKSDWTIVENSTFRWLATKWLRNAKWLSDTEFIYWQIAYYGSYWTFNKNTLYYSAWTLNNPFLYNFTTVLSIPWNVTWKINDLFIFKDRLIIWWDSYSAYLQWPLTLTTQINIITQSYWIIEKTLVDVWVDAYFISTNKHIFSLKENLTWTALVANDEWKIIWNYLKDYNFNLMWAFDWNKLYFYWEEIAWEPWIITVLDIQYKFWSTYTWLSPSSIKFNDWKIYLSDNNSDKIRVFSNEVRDDIWVAIEQKVTTKEIMLWEPFTIKTLTDIFIWVDNFVQDFQVKLYLALPWRNTHKSTKNISFSKWDIEWDTNPLWEWILWEQVIWWKSVESIIALPLMKHISYESDSAIMWKVVIVWKDWSPFYLNQLDVQIIPEKEKVYFSPENSI